MQLLSLGQLLGAVAVQPISPSFQELVRRPEMQRLIIIGGVLLVVGQVIQIVSCWGASKMLGREETATFKNAFNVWVGMLLFTFGLILAFGFVSPFVAQVREPWRVVSTYFGVMLLSSVIFFLIPMKIYAIGFWRALGILLLAGVMQWSVMAALGFAAGAVFLTEQDRIALDKLEVVGKVQSDQFGMTLDVMSGKNPTQEINRLLSEASAVPRPPLHQREATVRELQKRLDRQRQALPPGNPEAAAVFRQQLERYMRLLQEVKTERANTPANRSARYFPAENFTSLVTCPSA